MKIQKIVAFLYTYSMAIRFILVGSFMFIVELLDMSGRNTDSIGSGILPIDSSLLIAFSFISILDFFINNRKREVSYVCLLISVNVFFISYFLRLFGQRDISRITITIALLSCLLSFMFARTVRNRKNYNFLAITYLIFISATFLSYKPWLLFR